MNSGAARELTSNRMHPRRMKLDKPAPGARSISLAEFIQCLKTSSQIEEELTTAVCILSYLNLLSDSGRCLQLARACVKVCVPARSCQ